MNYAYFFSQFFFFHCQGEMEANKKKMIKKLYFFLVGCVGVHGSRNEQAARERKFNDHFDSSEDVCVWIVLILVMNLRGDKTKMNG